MLRSIFGQRNDESMTFDHAPSDKSTKRGGPKSRKVPRRGGGGQALVTRPFHFQFKTNTENRCHFLIFESFFPA